MSENRMMVKMETILALWTGKGSAGQRELMEFLTGRSLCEYEATLVRPLVKAWLGSQLPALMNTVVNPAAIYDDWLKKECARLGGENASLEAIPADEMAGIVMVLDKVAASNAAVTDAQAKVAAMEAKVAEMAPYKAKAEKFEKEATQLKGKVDGLTKDVADLKAQVAGFKGMVPVAEDDINATIKDIVTKALKDAVASVPLGAVAGAAAAAGDAAAADVAPAEEASAVPDDFGFGASGASSDGFGF
ncbi:hypothetical protein [Megalodesulfovibrio gigas]|uniref:Uncharacterized protein n=2 Tax=Megalodesulfovibrio gigas TaxID=879 RepID=S5VNU2_MEGGA|nr:hypothetical protein [Megalodesulfovibrio gigas]AGS82781.1 hypothetical protein [Megalodesulfovibrio gigas]AGW12366.1 putative qmoD protein [Megalodesulfovibrio gigas DSM 1382 = ATCC 19364]